MTNHYGNDDLLAHAFLPDEHAEVALHLASCESCARRSSALRDGLQRHAAPSEGLEKPDTFWKRQELGVMRTIDKRERRMPGVGARLAAAAAVVFVVVAFWAGRGSVANAPLTATIASSSTASVSATQENDLATSQLTTDPWQSEQLQDYQTVVAWETWDDGDQKKRGTI